MYLKVHEHECTFNVVISVTGSLFCWSFDLMLTSSTISVFVVSNCKKLDILMPAIYFKQIVH